MKGKNDQEAGVQVIVETGEEKGRVAETDTKTEIAPDTEKETEVENDTKGDPKKCNKGMKNNKMIFWNSCLKHCNPIRVIISIPEPTHV